MDLTEIHAKAIKWMVNRGWKQKWGKRGGFTQSLFQHTDIELNALLILLPILAEKAHYGLSVIEQQAMIVGTIAHDVGKETPEWQKYVQLPKEQQRGNFVPHVIPSLTDRVVPELVSWLGFDESIIADATNFVNLHMAGTQTATGIVEAILKSNTRWRVLARIVETIDKFCSIAGLLKTRGYLIEQKDNGVISDHVRLGYHLVALRGVSTTLLHRAARETYEEAGWQVLLDFSNGTIYVTDGRKQIEEPTPEQIMVKLTEYLSDVIEKDYSQLVVGTNFSSTVIPKPEFFNVKHLRKYLSVASTRLRTTSFESAHFPKPTATLEDIKNIEVSNFDLVRKYLDYEPSDDEVNLHIRRIADQQPDMGVWIFFSAAYKLGLLGNISNSFEAIFGPSSFERFQKCPKQRQFVGNMKYGVEIFGKMSGAKFNFPNLESMELVEPNTRIRLLIEKLTEIVEQSLTDQLVSPSAISIASHFKNDLIHPQSFEDIKVEAGQQLESYISTKERAYSKATKLRICPICNQKFDRGTIAKKDFVNSPESHTNRAISHGSTGSIIICDTCKYERQLQQLLLGEKTARILILTPRMHLGYWSGREFYNQARHFHEEAINLMTNSSKNPNEYVTLTLTNMIYRNLSAADNEGKLLGQVVKEGLSGDILANLLTYPLSPDKQSSHFSSFTKELRELYEFKEGEEDIAYLSELWGKSFENWGKFVQAVFAGEVRDELTDEIRAKNYNLQVQFKVVCQTPNFILIPLSEGKVGNFALNKDSDTNAALRELFILLLIGLALDCSVAAIDAGATITFEGGEGIARVPDVPAIRDLVGNEWIGLTDAPVWLEKIGAASLLTSTPAYRDESSSLYQILKAPTPGHILRRIEMKSKSGANYQQTQLILKALQEVLHA